MARKLLPETDTIKKRKKEKKPELKFCILDFHLEIRVCGRVCKAKAATVSQAYLSRSLCWVPVTPAGLPDHGSAWKCCPLLLSPRVCGISFDPPVLCSG